LVDFSIVFEDSRTCRCEKLATHWWRPRVKVVLLRGCKGAGALWPTADLDSAAAGLPIDFVRAQAMAVLETAPAEISGEI
jgi:hypothetical protein